MGCCSTAWLLCMKRIVSWLQFLLRVELGSGCLLWTWCFFPFGQQMWTNCCCPLYRSHWQSWIPVTYRDGTGTWKPGKSSRTDFGSFSRWFQVIFSRKTYKIPELIFCVFRLKEGNILKLVKIWPENSFFLTKKYKINPS